MSREQKLKYIRALMNVNALSPRWNTAKSIIGLLKYYSDNDIYGEIDIDLLEGNEKADMLFEVLQRYTCQTYRESFKTGCPIEVFSKFKIPLITQRIIKKKYEEALKICKNRKKNYNQEMKKQKINLIKDLNNELDKLL